MTGKIIESIIDVVIWVTVTLKLSWYNFRRQQIQDLIEQNLLLRKQVDRRIARIKEEFVIVEPEKKAPAKVVEPKKVEKENSDESINNIESTKEAEHYA